VFVSIYRCLLDMHTNTCVYTKTNFMQFSLPVKPYRKSPTSNKVEFKLQATDISRMPFCPLIHLHKIYRNLVAFQNTAKLKMCRRDYTAGFANPKEDRW